MGIGKIDVARAFLGLGAVLSGAGCNSKPEGCDAVPVVDVSKPLVASQVRCMSRREIDSYCDVSAHTKAGLRGTYGHNGEEVLARRIGIQFAAEECLAGVEKIKGEK